MTYNIGNLDLSEINIRRATTPADFELVRQIRAAGFGRVTEDPNHEWLDESDYSSTVRNLLAFSTEGEPLCTMRLEDGRSRGVELERYVPLPELLPPTAQPFTQFGRLSAIRHPRSRCGMFALFKAAWCWSLETGLETMVLGAPPWTIELYRFMFFRDLGDKGCFTHPLVGIPHRSMALGTRDVEPTWRAGGSPLCRHFCDLHHPHLELH